MGKNHVLTAMMDGHQLIFLIESVWLKFTSDQFVVGYSGFNFKRGVPESKSIQEDKEENGLSANAAVHVPLLVWSFCLLKYYPSIHSWSIIALPALGVAGRWCSLSQLCQGTLGVIGGTRSRFLNAQLHPIWAEESAFHARF